MRLPFRSRILLSAIVGLIVGLALGGAFAENVDPNGDNSQFAYGENVGWFNAEPSGLAGPGVQVSGSALTGYMWAENVGWVSMSCVNTGTCGTVSYGVLNDGAGTLSGYAYGENVGWISFSCSNTSSCGTVSYGVTINATTGIFSGRAWGENIGWVTFSATTPVAYRVQAGWCVPGAGGADPDGDGLTNTTEGTLGTDPCVRDTDLDGCSEAEEIGSNQDLGGDRDPLYFWDFYDTWTRPNPMTPWSRDRVVTVTGDIFAVARRFGSSRPGGAPTKPVALVEALTPPTSDTGYHTSYDRGPLVGPNIWDSGPPDGFISVVVDVLQVARSFGDTCLAAP